MTAARSSVIQVHDARDDVRTLGPAVADRVPVIYTNGDDVVVLLVTADGSLTSWRSEDDGTFEPTRSDVDPVAGFVLSAAAGRDDLAIAVGTNLRDWTPRVIVSEGDGPWVDAPPTGIQGGAELQDVVVTDAGWVVVGYRRPGGADSTGPFTPTAWRSPDGRTWTEVTLPGGLEGGVSSITSIGDDLLAVGNGAPAGQLWRSSDDGRTWALEALQGTGVPAGFRLSDIGTARGVLVAVGLDPSRREPTSRIVHSVDAGRTWKAATAEEGVADGLGFAHLDAATSGFTVASSRREHAGGGSRACYDDPSRCGAAVPVLLHSPDGRTFRQIALGDDLGVRDVDAVASDSSGLLVLVGDGDGGSWTTWTWPAGSTRPPITTPVMGTPPDTPPLAEPGAELVVGVRYRRPLDLHCGMGHLGTFNGGQWFLDEASGPTPETGAGEAPPPHWPVAQEQILGYVTLVDADSIEYSLPSGEVIATYEPRFQAPPVCA